jgi:hypothetical protein
MFHHRVRRFLAVWGLLALGLFTLGASPALLDLIARVEVIEEALFAEPIEVVLFEDDFEDGLDPAWVQVNGTTQTIAPTSDCTQAYFSKYPNCGSLGLYFDEVERYDYELPAPATGSFSLYFHDDPADTAAAAWIVILSNGNLERIGVSTDACPDTYKVSLVPGDGWQCSTVPRRLGWHRVEFVRTGTTTRGYIDYILVFETNRPGRDAFQAVSVLQEVPWLLLDGFQIDDVQFIATGGN